MITADSWTLVIEYINTFKKYIYAPAWENPDVG